MDAIGVQIPALSQVRNAGSAGGSRSVSHSTDGLPKPASNVPFPKIGGDGSDFDPAAAEQARYEAVQRMARQKIANSNVLGSTTFALFKDSTGQLITRFFNPQDGKVTYIPEPQMLSESRGSGTAQPLLTLQV